MPPKKKGPPKGAYTQADKLDRGTVIPDFKRNWIVGDSIGQGGFGCIYLVNSWKASHSLKHLGIPRYISNGTFSPNNQTPCRFLIMDRFRGDFDKILRNHQITPIGILTVSINVLNALEYMHSKGYAHADIKATNLLHQQSVEEVYLVDFGLVNRFQSDGKHCEEKIDPKFKDNGTVEFCSRDSHRGLQPSRRGDLEILVYNMIHWLARSHPNSAQTHSTGLPWGPIIGDPELRRKITPLKMDIIYHLKTKAMTNPVDFVENAGFGNIEPLVKFLQIVNQMSYTTCPDYHQLRNLLSNTATFLSGSSTKSVPKPSARVRKRQAQSSSINNGLPSSSSSLPSPIPDPIPKRNPRKPTNRLKKSSLSLNSLITDKSPAKSLRLGSTTKKKNPDVVQPVNASPVSPRTRLRTPKNPSTQKTPLPKSGAGDHSISNLFSSDDDFQSPAKSATRKPLRLVQTTPKSDRSRKPKRDPVSTLPIAQIQNSELPVAKTPPKLVSRRSGFCQTSPELLRIARAEYLNRRLLNHRSRIGD